MNNKGIRTYFSGTIGEVRYSEVWQTSLSFPRNRRLSLKYVLQGEEAYAVNGIQYQLRAGQALFFRDQQPYDAFVDSQELTKGLCIDLDLQLIQRAVYDPLLEREQFFFCPSFRAQKLAGLPKATELGLRTLVSDNSTEPTLQLEEQLQDLAQQVLFLEEEYVHKMAALPIKKGAYRRAIFQRLLMAKNYLHDAQFQPIKLAELATACNLSPFYLHRLFRNAFGCTPAIYQENLRMQKAHQLLLQQYAIKEVAYSLGYSDTSFFCRRFKKYYGSSPSQYRQQNGN